MPTFGPYMKSTPPLKPLLLIAVFLLPLLVSAQESNLGNWLIYFGNKKLGDRFNWHHEVQYRNYNAIGDLEQLLLRTGIGYNLTENNHNLLVGYGFIRSENYFSDNDTKVVVNEHRIYQQFITKQTANRIKLQHRYRFEQRFVEADYRMRFRYFLSINVPLNHREMEDKTLYLSTYNEIFLNSERVVFDRNRLYGGLGYKLNNHVRFEAGYMNQFLNTFNRDQINLIAFVGF